MDQANACAFHPTCPAPFSLRMARIQYAIVLAGLLLTAVVPVHGDAGTDNPDVNPDVNTDVVVPAGTVMAVHDAIDAQRVLVYGTLLQDGPGDLWLNATELVIAPGGQIRARDGIPAPPTLAEN